MSSLMEAVKRHARKLGAAGADWLEEREKDQKRLDWLGSDGTRIGKVAELVGSKCDAREAIDDLMARDPHDG